MDFKDATDRLALPLEVIAEITGRSYATILAYRQGTRQPPADVWRALAEHAKRHTADLKGLTKELSDTADKLERSP